jgi:hypothetical protein
MKPTPSKVHGANYDYVKLLVECITHAACLGRNIRPWAYSLSAYLAFELDDHCLFARIMAKYCQVSQRNQKTQIEWWCYSYSKWAKDGKFGDEPPATHFPEKCIGRRHIKLHFLFHLWIFLPFSILPPFTFIVPSLWSHSQLPSLSQAPQLPGVGNSTSSIVRKVSASVVVKILHGEPGRLTECQLETGAAIYERFGPHHNITKFIAFKDGNIFEAFTQTHDWIHELVNSQLLCSISVPSSCCTIAFNVFCKRVVHPKTPY